jgi:hypothetical protein
VGFGGYPAGQASIQVLVNEPTTLTALYRTEPNYLVLILVLLLPLLAVALYLGVTRGWFIDGRARLRERIRDVRARRKLLFWAELHGRNGTHLPVPAGEERRD